MKNQEKIENLTFADSQNCVEENIDLEWFRSLPDDLRSFFLVYLSVELGIRIFRLICGYLLDGTSENDGDKK